LRLGHRLGTTRRRTALRGLWRLGLGLLLLHPAQKLGFHLLPLQRVPEDSRFGGVEEVHQ
jgi:hypothetical protein